MLSHLQFEFSHNLSFKVVTVYVLDVSQFEFLSCHNLSVELLRFKILSFFFTGKVFFCIFFFFFFFFLIKKFFVEKFKKKNGKKDVLW